MVVIFCVNLTAFEEKFSENVLCFNYAGALVFRMFFCGVIFANKILKSVFSTFDSLKETLCLRLLIL